MNKVVLIGRLTKDPDMRFTPGDGKAVTSVTLAVDRRFKNAQGEKEADFIPVVIWGKQAEATANYMSKGSLMGVSGRIQTRNYEAKDGTRRYVTEVVADEVQFLDSKGKKQTVENTDFGVPVQDGDFDMDMQPVDSSNIPF